MANDKANDKANDNTVFIGKKPVMSYVLAVMTQFSRNNEVRIKARGRSISTAVDIAEITRNRFVKADVADVKIGTDIVQSERGNSNVSSIEILLRKA